MLTLSEKGVSQIEETSKDKRLIDAQLIITSPFGRTMHSAAILSRELNIALRVETDLHEWLADYINYEFLSDEEANKLYNSLSSNNGQHPAGEKCKWESAIQMKKRVLASVKFYSDNGK